MDHPTNQPGKAVAFVSLIAGSDGVDSVALELASGEMVVMTPTQARSLATSLITAVNRAEVKTSLRVSTNLWRRMGDAEARLSTTT